MCRVLLRNLYFSHIYQGTVIETHKISKNLYQEKAEIWFKNQRKNSNRDDKLLLKNEGKYKTENDSNYSLIHKRFLTASWAIAVLETESVVLDELF